VRQLLHIMKTTPVKSSTALSSAQNSRVRTRRVLFQHFCAAENSLLSIRQFLLNLVPTVQLLYSRVMSFPALVRVLCKPNWCRFTSKFVKLDRAVLSTVLLVIVVVTVLSIHEFKTEKCHFPAPSFEDSPIKSGKCHIPLLL
jgi:hypothetical protein